MDGAHKTSGWMPPETVSREAVLETSAKVLALPDIPFTEAEDVFRITAAGLDWDIGVRLYVPGDETVIPVGPDGKKVGIFMLHGGQDDWRQLEPMAKFLVGKFGYKVMTGTFPGRLYLQDESRNWPGDTIKPDGSVRTPIWLKDELIGREEYEVVKDDTVRWRCGIRTVARALPGTNFFYRMAAWPMAMEAGFVEACRRHLPEGEFSVYGQGHSTGGPNMSMLSQRIPNMVGCLAAEHSAFGMGERKKWQWRKEGNGNSFDQAAKDEPWRSDRFTDVEIRTWRDWARYAGPEALRREGASALMRLPSLMDDVLEHWNRNLNRPRFKCEYVITHNMFEELEAAARVTAERLGYDDAETGKLVDHYLHYPVPMSGPGVKPVPPFLFGVAANSRDHTRDNYLAINLPTFASFDPPAKATLTFYEIGVHQLWMAEEGLPWGILPRVVSDWKDAIDNGFFLA